MISHQKKTALKRQIAKLNPERFKLIQKSVRGKLTQQESERLEYLQAETKRLVDQIAPLPDLLHGMRSSGEAEHLSKLIGDRYPGLRKLLDGPPSSDTASGLASDKKATKGLPKPQRSKTGKPPLGG